MIEVVLQVRLRDMFAQVSHVQGRDSPVLRRLQRWQTSRTFHDLLGHRIVYAVIPVLDVLLGQRIVRFVRLVVSIRTLFAALALALHPEGADVRSIPFVIRSSPSELGEDVTRSDGLAHSTRDHGTATQFRLGQFPVHVLDVVLLVHVTRGQVVLYFQGRVSHLRRQPVLKVQQTRLADILQFAARLTHFRLLEAHPGAGTPPEDGEGSVADLALLAETLRDHPD